MPRITDLPTDTAPDPADIVPFVDVTASRTEAVTVANLAASTAFSGTYAPIASPTFTGNVVVPDADAATEAMNRQTSDARYQSEIWVGASDMLQVTTTATYTTFGWLLDASTIERLSFSLPTRKFPTHWTTFNVDIYWTNAGAGSGDVRWLWLDLGGTVGAADGGALSATYELEVTATAPAQNVLEITRLQSAKTVGSGDFYWWRIDRNASDAADTLANDAQLLGLLFTKNT